MSGPVNCTRCGAEVSPVLGPPPRDRDRWTRYGVTMRARTHTLRFRMFKLRWLPENPWDQLCETWTELTLCDPCAADVFLFAQGKEPAEASR